MAVREPVADIKPYLRVVITEVQDSSEIGEQRTGIEKILKRVMLPIAAAHNWMDEPENRIMAGYIAVSLAFHLLKDQVLLPA